MFINFTIMKRIILCILILWTVSLSAQESSNYGLDNRWSIKSGAGYFFVPMEMGRGYSLWCGATYSLPSRLEFQARLGHSTSSTRMSAEMIERLWPSDGGFGYRANERTAYDYYLFEVGVSYPFILKQRHRIALGTGISLSYERNWKPSHEGTVSFDRLGVGYDNYYGLILPYFYRTLFTLYFNLEVEYTYHFNNGFFVGLCAHTFYDFTLPFITISPLLGVRF